MAGTGGKRDGAGRPKGAKNKINKTAAEIMAEYNVSGIDGLSRIASGQALECTIGFDKSGKPISGKMKPTFDNIQAAFKELAQYEAPKLKAIEHKNDPNNPVGGVVVIERQYVSTGTNPIRNP